MNPPPPLHRDTDELDRSFDLLVIGGGIYGAWIACDAALRGLSVAIVDQGDWAGGASSASSKLIHGGLRYLEYGKIALVTKTLAERTRLLRLAPHRVHPLRFIAPVWPDSRTGALALGIGLAGYDALAALGASGNAGTLPGHQRFSAENLRESFPYLAPGLKAGFAYGDAGEDDARFTLEIIAAAQAAGAVAVNHCAVTRLLFAKKTGSQENRAHPAGGADATVGAAVHDRITGISSEIRAKTVVVATGAWTTTLLENSGLPPTRIPPLRRSRGVHLVMPPLPPGPDGTPAFLLTTRSPERRKRRVFFLIPWQGATLLGTTDDDFTGSPGTAGITAADVDHLLGEATARCPGLRWTRSDIRAAFAGERTLVDSPGAASTAVSREWELANPAPGLFASLGGKYTSARVEAALTVDRVQRASDRPAAGSRSCATGELAFPWRPPDDPAWLETQIAAGKTLGLDPACARAAAERLGTAVIHLHARLRTTPQLATRIVASAPICLGEAVHAVTGEMALNLDDVLRRRLAIALTAPPDAEAVQRVARAIAQHLAWTDAHAEAAAAAWCRQRDTAESWR
jgi:glycerol-3-phosphate dehydrogenase